jgi:hypothetical protein
MKSGDIILDLMNRQNAYEHKKLTFIKRYIYICLVEITNRIFLNKQ